MRAQAFTTRGKTQWVNQSLSCRKRLVVALSIKGGTGKHF
ncbi:Uncharacterised protein [Vibrio cholerae]|nr:Uncharacterised protein [Vibrio cholerae]